MRPEPPLFQHPAKLPATSDRVRVLPLGVPAGRVGWLVGPRRVFRHSAAFLIVFLLGGALGAAVAIVLRLDARSGEVGRTPSQARAAKPGVKTRPSSERTGRDPVAVAAGDIACDPLASTFKAGFGTSKRCRQGATAELVASLKPDAVFVLGDIQYEDGRYWKYMRSYDPSWGRFKQITHPTPGSHDRGRGYRRYWGARAGRDGSHWYSFDIGAWHVVSLNSNCGKVGGCESGSPQEQWLRADLVAHPAPCTLAFWHEPRFSSSKRAASNMEAIWQALSDFGAELVLSGDAHNYERFRPQDAAGHRDPRRGIRQFVVGTGGASLDPFEERSAGSLVRNATTIGVLKLTLHPKRYEWRFVGEAGSSFTDGGSASCHR